MMCDNIVIKYFPYVFAVYVGIEFILLIIHFIQVLKEIKRNDRDRKKLY